MESAFEYVFPAISGIQSGREYYISMCPLRLIPKIFLFDEEELRPELRAQRVLNKNRIPEMSNYILNNIDSYVFSAITASIDGDVHFEPLESEEGGTSRIGKLHIPMKSLFIINDGQHRRAAIERALHENPELGNESIAVVFFIDIGLERCQQMFADLNRYAVRPSKSLGVLYDHRDELAELTRLVVLRSKIFRDFVEMERSTLPVRSSKLFTLSSIYSANLKLLNGTKTDSMDKDADLVISFWEEVAKQFPEWQLVRERKMTAGEVRKDFIHSHGIVLQAIGSVGNVLIHDYPKDWKKKLEPISKIDWSRDNAKLWEGRAMIGGRVSKASHNVTLTTNAIKNHLGLPLAPEEQRVEDAFKRGEYEKGE